jgi:ribosomal protein S18 acetylase RimI-like enzyme
MANDGISLREGSPKDFAALSGIDGSVPNDWVLHIARHGGPAELDIQLRWQQVKTAGSRRRVDTAESLDELHTEWKRSDRLLIANVDGDVAGCLMLGQNWNRTAELTLVIVDRAHRRKGIGQRFVEQAEAYARERGLRALQWEAQNDNRTAIDFALARGFRIAGFHDALYRNDDLDQQETADFRGIALYLTKPVT